MSPALHQLPDMNPIALPAGRCGRPVTINGRHRRDGATIPIAALAGILPRTRGGARVEGGCDYGRRSPPSARSIPFAAPDLQGLRSDGLRVSLNTSRPEADLHIGVAPSTGASLSAGLLPSGIETGARTRLFYSYRGESVGCIRAVQRAGCFALGNGFRPAATKFVRTSGLQPRSTALEADANLNFRSGERHRCLPWFPVNLTRRGQNRVQEIMETGAAYEFG